MYARDGGELNQERSYGVDYESIDPRRRQPPPEAGSHKLVSTRAHYQDLSASGGIIPCSGDGTTGFCDQKSPTFAEKIVATRLFLTESSAVANSPVSDPICLKKSSECLSS